MKTLLIERTSYYLEDELKDLQESAETDRRYAMKATVIANRILVAVSDISYDDVDIVYSDIKTTGRIAILNDVYDGITIDVMLDNLRYNATYTNGVLYIPAITEELMSANQHWATQNEDRFKLFVVNSVMIWCNDNMDTLIHEIVHHIDVESNRVNPNRKGFVDADTEYYSSPAEFNANFLTAIRYVYDQIKPHPEIISKYVATFEKIPTAAFNMVLNYIRKFPMDKHLYEKLTPEYKRKFVRRLYKTINKFVQDKKVNDPSSD